MKKLFRSKRGISPVISTVLMIMVVMVGMTILFGFLATYAQGFQNGSGSAVLESMTVEDIWFKSSPSTAEVWVYNIGKVDLKITNIYIDGQQAGLTPPSVTVQVGGHEKITVTPPAGTTFAGGDSYSFKIITERGSAFQQTFFPPR